MAKKPEKAEDKTGMNPVDDAKVVKEPVTKKLAVKKAAVKKEIVKEKPVQVEAAAKTVAKTTATKKEAIKESAAQEPIEEIKKATQIDSKQKYDEKKPDRGALFLGLGLLAFGVLLMAGRLLSIPFGEFIWPFLFIVPGGLIFAAALSTDDRHGEGLSILGSILTVLGIVFLIQSVFNLWASWAYIWALVAPTSIGIGQWAYGTSKNRESIAASGRRLVNLGLVLVGFGFVFFELIIGLNGFGISRYGIPPFPATLIFLGGFILVRSIIRNR